MPNFTLLRTLPKRQHPMGNRHERRLIAARVRHRRNAVDPEARTFHGFGIADIIRQDNPRPVLFGKQELSRQAQSFTMPDAVVKRLRGKEKKAARKAQFVAGDTFTIDDSAENNGDYTITEVADAGS